MKAPDKIYVCIPQRLNMSTFKEDSKYVGMAYTDKGNLTSPQIEEYISKETLLEWAKEHYTSLDITKRDMWDGGYNYAMKELIDKINSL